LNAALASYEVKIVGEDVIVVAEESLLKEGRRVQAHSTLSQDDSRVFVVIGGGPAGFVAARTLREEGFTGKVTTS